MAVEHEQMAWGKHKGKLIMDLPDKYLLWLYEAKKAKPEILEWIKQKLKLP